MPRYELMLARHCVFSSTLGRCALSVAFCFSAFIVCVEYFFYSYFHSITLKKRLSYGCNRFICNSINRLFLKIRQPHACCVKSCDTTNSIIVVLVIVVHVAVTEIDVPRVIIVVGILRRRPILPITVENLCFL